MSESYTIVCTDLTLEEVIGQINHIKAFPCVIDIYDRCFTLSNVEEAFTLKQGLEVGWFLCEEFWEKSFRKKNTQPTTE